MTPQNFTSEKNTSNINGFELKIYGIEDQAVGAFDGGKIRETKPIGFPGEGSKVRRVGPLFYWAWAYSQGPAIIGMHPHQGFEIVSYVLRGQIGHKDTGGNQRVLNKGGLQIMQTASGISHEEQMLGDDGTDFFQIWFEPDLHKTVTQPAVYKDYELNQIPSENADGVSVHHMIGPKGVFELDTDALMDKVVISNGSVYPLNVKAGRSLAIVIMEGAGTFDGSNKKAERKEFVLIEANEDSIVTVTTETGEDLEMMVIDIPQRVDYNLYEKG